MIPLKASYITLAVACFAMLPAKSHAVNQRADRHALTYSAIRPQLKHSAVPILLPMQLPPALGVIASVAVVSADRNGYYVAFSTVAHCSGARSCAALHVSGYVRTSLAGRTFGNDRLIRLPDGTRGFFAPRDCSGTNCTEASLTFEHHHTIYEIDANVAENSLPTLTSVYQALRCVDPLAADHHGR